MNAYHHGLTFFINNMDSYDFEIRFFRFKMRLFFIYKEEFFIYKLLISRESSIPYLVPIYFNAD